MSFVVGGIVVYIYFKLLRWNFRSFDISKNGFYGDDPRMAVNLLLAGGL